MSELIERLFGSGERSKPGVLDLAFTAFMRSRGKNDEDGGPTDWTNDTRPLLQPHVDEMRAEVVAGLEALRERLAEVEGEKEELAIEHSKQIADMATRFRAVNIQRVIEQTGQDIFEMADKLQAAEEANKRLREALDGIIHFSDALDFREDTLSKELRRWIDAARSLADTHTGKQGGDNG